LVFVAALIGLQGEHGQLSFDQFSPGEVRAAQYLYTTAPKGSVLVDAASNVPSRLNERYNDFNDGGGDLYDLRYFLPTDRSTITAQDMTRIDDHYAGVPNVYVIISKSQIAYAHYFGYLRDGLIESLQRTMETSPFWKVIYRNDDAVIYKSLN
ncbi:MAG TPA: hypothetical protein VE132_13985, partial [Micromonosporaceae bacterium]|nr:hypothetical protein [Micromonosporaceae bacterium]